MKVMLFLLISGFCAPPSIGCDEDRQGSGLGALPHRHTAGNALP